MFFGNHFVRILVFSLSLLLLSACGGAEGRKAKYLERGKSQMKEEKFDKAQVEFRNVLQIDPKNAQAYYYLGQIAEKQRNLQQAFGYYSKTVELAPDNLDAQSKIGRLLLLSGNIDKTKDIA